MARTKLTAGGSGKVPFNLRKPNPDRIHHTRRKPGVAAIKEIRMQQKSTKLLIPKAAFDRLVREIIQDYKGDMCFQPRALSAMQTAVEDYLVTLFNKTNEVAIYAKRQTITPRDMRMARRMRGEENVPSD